MLNVENLSTVFFTRAGLVKAVSDVSFSVNKSEVLAISMTVFGTNLLGDALRDILDPRQRG